MTTTTEAVDARNISCQGLAQSIDPDVLTFHGQPVTGYTEEMARRGENHVYSCDLVGHIPDDLRISRDQMHAAVAALGLTHRLNDITQILLNPHEVWITEQVRDDEGHVIITRDGTPQKRSTCVSFNLA